MGNDLVDEFVEEVTAPVTGPWVAVGMTEEEWRTLSIPDFLIRRASAPKPAPVPDASACVGLASGPASNTPSTAATSPTGLTGGFEHFRVDPQEIERKIKAEADRQWREWMPTKTDRKRPTKRGLIKRIRKEYYP